MDATTLFDLLQDFIKQYASAESKAERLYLLDAIEETTQNLRAALAAQ